MLVVVRFKVEIPRRFAKAFVADGFDMLLHEALETALQDKAIRPEAIEILRSMIERVVVTPTKAGEFRVDLHGDIARLIAADAPISTAAAKTKRAASSYEGDRNRT